MIDLNKVMCAAFDEVKDWPEANKIEYLRAVMVGAFDIMEDQRRSRIEALIQPLTACAAETATTAANASPKT